MRGGECFRRKGIVMSYPGDDPFPVNLGTRDTADTGDPNTITSMLRDWAARPPAQSSSLSLLLAPDDIASIPGLPQHVYDGCVERYRSAAQG